MVKVQEVHDSPYASSASAHSGSTDSLDTVSDIDDIEQETVLDRIVALVDIVPPQTRFKISSKVSSFLGTVKSTSKVVGNVVWVLTTSAILVGLPLALALEDESKIVQQEKEIAAQQQGAQQMLNPSMGSMLPGSEKKEGLVPPGF